MTNNAIPWHEWNPGLDNDDQPLKAVRDTLPGAPPEEISWLVRLMENPESPLALTGAVSLERHDCIHILLGRGLLNQDEAFVIGYTMGTAKQDLRAFEIFLFKKVARHLYPTPYRLTKADLKAYQLGVAAGRAAKAHKIYDFPFEDHDNTPLGELRTLAGVDKTALRTAYAEEKNLLPDTKASQHLPL